MTNPRSDSLCRNECTRYHALLRERCLPAIPWDTLEQCVAEVNVARAQRLERPALLVVTVRCAGGTGEPEVQHTLRFVDGDPVAVAVGRHTHTDLALHDDASLRHLVVIAHADGEESCLEVLDLRSTAGCVNADGAKSAFVAGDSTVLVGVPDTWVLSIVAASHQRLRLERVSVTIAPPDPAVVVDAPKRPTPLERGTSVAYTMVAPHAREDDAVHVEDGTVVLDELLLWRGVLIGRDARCDVRIDETLVSRVHALLLRRGTRNLVIDLGSTNGTEIEVATGGLFGARVAARVLSGSGRLACWRDALLLRIGRAPLRVIARIQSHRFVA